MSCPVDSQSEEHKGGEHSPPSEIANTMDVLRLWWFDFRMRYPVDLYALILATEADTSAADLISNHAEALAELSGRHCCFIGLRGVSRAQDPQGFASSEYSAGIYKLLRLLGINPSQLPLVVFLGSIYGAEQVRIGLRGLSTPECITVLREVFAPLPHHAGKNPLAIVAGYRRSDRIHRTEEVIQEDARALGNTVLAELISKLGTVL